MKAAEMLKAEVASLQEEEKKRSLQEELKLRDRTAQIKIQQQREEAARLKVEAELLSQYGQSKEKKSVREFSSKDCSVDCDQRR